MASLRRIHHVAISIPPERHADSVRFYRDVLGFEELPVPRSLTHAPILAWFKVGSAELHLMGEPNDARGVRRHVCFEVDDLNEFRRRLEDAGEWTEPGDPIPGRPRFFCYDPAGNRIEFLVDESAGKGAAGED